MEFQSTISMEQMVCCD